MEAVVLVGGFGTRLRPIVNDRPKAMALVAGRPFLEWLIEDIRQQGTRRVVLCTGYMSEYIEDYFGSGSSWGMEIIYSRERTPRGTGGAIRLALPKLQSQRFFVLNGDSFCDFDLKALHRTHLKASALATLWLVTVANSDRYGAITVNSNNEITEFQEKSVSGRPGLINAGVYLLDRRIIEALPEDEACSLEKDLFPGLVGRGLFAVVGKGPFLDIGTPESYKLADVFINRRNA